MKGLAFDWNKLYAEGKPRRISLPTYPFAKERSWVPEFGDDYCGEAERGGIRSGSSDTSVGATERLEPIGAALRFQRFTGEEFFLSDHVVKGQRVMPGVASLEMARAALLEAQEIPGPAPICLKNIVWARPLTVMGQGAEVHIGLYPEESGEIEYEIYTSGVGVKGGSGRSEEGEDDRIVHAPGRGFVVSTASESPRLDLATLQGRCNRRTLYAAQCYEAFKAAGVDYGLAPSRD